ncbi:integrase [Novosphingobium sp. SG751A]|uniref:tyrosine-type recombinase/integrase n=1 Tax=Novosphingobium sp. SG751A TaxID=2587000 RepID=UPI001C12AA89|nr:tyrosine-type recombinase/integrase [Novosphingobium sp. SG751A]NOW48448.1 integrase [Novosphingobium sp. SG751A]
MYFPHPHNPNKPIKIWSDWQEIRQRAGLGDLRLHDLRHSFASLAIRQGISLTIISRLLGHALPETTERYAHLADDSISEAADRVCSVLAQGLGVAA